jgi:type III pantothenate kinase
VPDLTRSIANCARKYFNIEPFIVNASIKKTLLLPSYGNSELGADRIADIEGALHLYPKKDLIIADFGTANTFCAVSKNGEYKGGAISAGIIMSMNALANGAALLSNVEIKNPGCAAGMDTATQLQAGLFYAGLGSIKEICGRLAKECFNGQEHFIIGTGGLGRLYENEKVFDVYQPDLVLRGLKVLYEKNK